MKGPGASAGSLDAAKHEIMANLSESVN